MKADPEKTLLSYSEAYEIYEEYDDDDHIGTCLANIGVIFMYMEAYEMAYESFKQAIDKQKES